MLSAPLRDRFGVISRLEYYSSEDLLTIIKRSSKLLGVPVAEEGAVEVCRRSRGTPRIANRLLRRLRDFAEVKGDGVISKEIAEEGLSMLGSRSSGIG